MPTSRRRFLLGLAVTPVAMSLSCSGETGPSVTQPGDDGRRPLPIPPLAESTVDGDGTRRFTLLAAAGRTEIVAGTSTPTWGYNGTILGPTLRARRGENVAVTFENGLDVPTTVHWHGMHLPARCDGGPHQTVRPGEQWQPTWTVRQPAATLWYHPHPHGETEKHVYRGLAGMFLVDDDEAAGSLPNGYGIDDVPLIIQDRRFTASGALDESDSTDVGLLGDVIVTNGIAGAFLPIRSQRVRLRVLNGSGGRLYNLGFDDDREFHVVGSDGGLLSAPVAVDRVQLSPGERAEIVVELRPDRPVMLRSYPIEDHAGLHRTDAARFGVDDDFDVIELRPGPTLRPNARLPQKLAAVPVPDLSAVQAERSFDMQWFMINHQRMDMNRIDFRAEVDTTEVWTVQNVDDWPHNFHIHDAQFRIVDVDGSPPPPQLAGYKDTVYLAPGRRIRLAIRFIEHTDPTYPYMYHCHLAMHEDQGMMGQFLVLGPDQEPAPMTTNPSGGADHAMR